MTKIIHRLQGLDSIRFVCAGIVVLGHFGIPLSAQSTSFPILTKLIHGFLISLFNGPAAVIVFFVISGLCIHYPQRESAGLLIRSFYLQRAVRIGIPALFAICVWEKFHLCIKSPDFIVLWSIVCECIYYFLYPILLRLARRWSWALLIAVSYIAGLIVISTHLPQIANSSNSYVALGSRWTWLIGLPCWLSGCWLAENFQYFPKFSTSRIWAIRLAVFAISVVLRVVKFLSTGLLASNCVTLNMFAVVSCLWLGCEISFYRKRSPSKILEWAGTWSYSLYMIHPVVPAVVGTIFSFTVFPAAQKALILVLAFVFSYIFFCIVEFPSHLFAKAIGRQFRDKMNKTSY